jgi:hypothetical protein
MKESDLQHAIRLSVGAQPGRVVLWRNNVGEATHVSSGRISVVRYGLAPGSADLVGLRADGRFVALELKAPGGRVRPEQAAWLELVRRMGGVGAVVRSVDEAWEAIG